MSDDGNRNDAPDTGEHRQGDAGPSYVTADQLDETLGRFRDGLFGMVRGELQKMQRPAPSESQRPEPSRSTDKKADSSDQIQQMQSEVEHMKLKATFAELAADAGLDKSQRQRLEKSFMAERPEDPGSWLEEWKSVLGPATGTDQPVDKAEDVRTPARRDPVPAGTEVDRPSDDILRWSKDDLARDMQMKAPVPENIYDIRNKEYYQGLSKRVRSALARTRVYIGPEK